jgi:hypothetical protein
VGCGGALGPPPLGPSGFLDSLIETRVHDTETLPAVRFGGGARIRRPSSQSETGTIDREHRMGIEDPELDVAEQLVLIDLDEDDEELPELGQSPLEADPADFTDQRRR